MRQLGWLLAALLAAAGAGAEPAANDTQATVTQDDMARVDEIYRKYVNPGPEHQLLQPLVGTFSYASAFWPMVGAEPIRDAGTAEYTWMYDKRFLRQTASGTAMGLPYEGTGILGFDRYRGEFFSMWFDNMTTAVVESRGHADASGKVITYETTRDNIWEDIRDQRMTSVLTVEGDRSHRFEMFIEDADGNAFKNLEIVYTRQAPGAD